MRFFAGTILMTFSLFAFCLAQTAQTVTHVMAPSLSEIEYRYISEKDNFTIFLLPVPTRSSETKNAGSKLGGHGTIKTWEMREGDISVSHNIFPEPVLGKDQHMDDYAGIFKKAVSVFTRGAKPVSEYGLGILGISGVGLEFQATDGSKIIANAYTRGNEEFIIIGTVKKDVPRAEELIRSAVQSFRLYEKPVIVSTGGVQTAYPAATGIMHSDLKDERLRGKVKSLILEWEIGGRPRQKADERFYDAFGNLTRRVDHTNGIPTTEYIFTSDYKTGEYTRTKRALAPQPDSGAEKEEKKDESDLYVSRHFKYDTQGRTIEKVTRDREGKQISRMKIVYDGNLVSEAYYDKDGKNGANIDYTLNKNGDVIKEIAALTNPLSSGPFAYTYEYLSFDEFGNWTKREIHSIDPTKHTEHRTITYWP